MRFAPVVMLLLLLAAWQVLGTATGAHAISAPGPTLARLAALLQSARFWRDAAATGLAFGWALLLSMAAGVALGLAFAAGRAAGDAAEPVLLGFHALPKVTLYPLVLLGFGLGISAKIAFGVMHAIVPVVLMTRTAALAMRPVHRRTARMLRLSPLATARFILLPAMLPELAGALRIGVSLSLLGVLIGEMFAAKAGLGFAAMNAMGIGDIRTIMAIGLFLAAVAIAANAALLALERALR